MAWLVTLLYALLPALAFASGDAAHGEGTTSAQWVTLVLTFINFGIFVFLMRHFARVPLRDYLVGRRKEVVEALAEAARAKEEAERLKSEYEQKAAQLGAMREALLKEIAAMAAADRDKTLEAAAVAADRLRRDAELTARSDLERARRELRAEAARLAAELASTEIRQKLTDAQREKLLKEFLASVEGRP